MFKILIGCALDETRPIVFFIVFVCAVSGAAAMKEIPSSTLQHMPSGFTGTVM